MAVAFLFFLARLVATRGAPPLPEAGPSSVWTASLSKMTMRRWELLAAHLCSCVRTAGACPLAGAHRSSAGLLRGLQTLTSLATFISSSSCALAFLSPSNSRLSSQMLPLPKGAAPLQDTDVALAFSALQTFEVRATQCVAG